MITELLTVTIHHLAIPALGWWLAWRLTVRSWRMRWLGR